MSGGIVGVATPDPGTNALINRLANPPNPFEQLGTTVNALTNLRQFQANQAGANAYRQAVDPTTGQLDIGLYNRLMAAGPGAYNLGAAMQQAGQGVEAQGRGTQANVQAKLDQLAVQQAYMGPALAKAQQGTLTADDLTKSLDAVPAGIIDPATQASIRAQIASGENPNTIVLGGYFASQQGREMLKAQMPTYGTIDTGPTIYPTQANPLAPGGTQYPTQGMPKAMTPGQSGTPVDVPLPGGNTAKMPAGVFAAGPDVQRLWLQQNYPQIYGAPPAAPSASGHYPAPAPAPAAAPTVGGAPPAAAPPATTTPPPDTGTPSWLQPPPPVVPGPTAGDVGITPNPNYIESQKTTGAASTAAANALQSQVSASKDQLPLLDDMQSKLQSGVITTGVGSTVVNSVRQLMQRFQLSPTTPGGAVNTADPTAMQDEFVKDAALLQAAQLRMLGQPSDARQELAEETNPGLLLSTYGNLGIVNMLRGNQYAIRAQGQAWGQAQRAGWDPSRFNEWQNQHFLANDPATGGRFDPRMFWIASMSPADQRKYINQLPTDQQAQLAANRSYALNNGWLTQRSDGSFAVANQ